MSWQPCDEPDCLERSDEIELIIKGQPKDLGGFAVRRVLPAAKRRMVGPYVFFDHAGPACFPAGEGIDVRPHPHIGISTVTFLFEGEIMHRDSLGYAQPVQPGAVNLMTAGRGIVHSERSPEAQRQAEAGLHGIQLWLALPKELEDCAPSFTHYPAETIPVASGQEPRVTVIIGEAFGARSPVAVPTPTLYAELVFAEGEQVVLPDSYEERAVYIVEGAVRIGDCSLEAGDMAVLRPGTTPNLTAGGPAKAMLIGGASVPEKRTLWWNFVSSSKERIEQAKADWQAGRFESVPGDSEFIPLPD